MQAPASERRWDPLVRITHWGIAAAIVANGALTGEGSTLHVWVGYAAAGLLALRLLWGLIGSSEARFAAFPPSPSRALAHLRDIAGGRYREHRSHNPLGALMVYMLWGTLAVVVATGIAMAGPPELSPDGRAPLISINAEQPEEGDEEAHEAGEGDEMIEELHEIAANLLFILAAAHVAGVAFETRRSGPQIVRAMLPGRRRRAVAE